MWNWIDPLGLACKRPKHDTERPIDSPHYTAAFEAKLARGKDYPDVGDYYHFQEANKQLDQAMKADPRLAQDMEKLYPGISDFVTPGKRGKYSGKTPSKIGLTWHHNPHKAGSIELVPVNHHQSAGIVQTSLHPNQQGGMEVWGGGR